jgi:hypothetical protein
MVEGNRQLDQLYAQYRALSHGEPAVSKKNKIPLVRELLNKLGDSHSDGDRNNRVARVQIRLQIIDILRQQPGSYPLAELSFSPANGQDGFQYAFHYLINDDTFRIGYWRYNDWGICVQKQILNQKPEIEVLKGGVINTILHLPENYQIPVGPLHFPDDNLILLSEAEKLESQKKAIAIAKAAGIHVNKKILDMASRISPQPEGKLPDRYFFWQPELPDTPMYLAIDFDSLMPSFLGRSLENAPVLKNTIIIQPE